MQKFHLVTPGKKYANNKIAIAEIKKKSAKPLKPFQVKWTSLICPPLFK